MKFFKWFRKGGVWEDDELSKMASDRAAEITRMEKRERDLRHKIKVLEKQQKITELEDQIDRLTPQEEPPQQNNQMSEIMTILALFQAFQNKGSGGSDNSFAEFMASLQGSNMGEIFGGSSPDQPFPVSKKNPNPKLSEFAVSDEEIRENLALLPPDKLKLAKTLPAPMIKSYVKKNFNYDDETIERAIQIAKQM